MKLRLALYVGLAIAGWGCKNGSQAESPAAKLAAAGLDFSGAYADIRTRTAAARTADDFRQLATGCGDVVSQAAQRQVPVAETREFQKNCQLELGRAQARVAIADSTPGAPSSQCMTALVAIEDARQAAKGDEQDDVDRLERQLRDACAIPR